MVAGPDPRTLVVPIEQPEMYTAVVTIAGEWLDAPWSTLIHRSYAAQQHKEQLTQREVQGTVSFIHYTFEQGKAAT